MKLFKSTDYNNIAGYKDWSNEKKFNLIELNEVNFDIVKKYVEEETKLL